LEDRLDGACVLLLTPNTMNLVASIRFVGTVLCFLAWAPLLSSGAESAPAPVPPTKTEETNAQEMLRSYLQLQEQIHATTLAIERTRKEAEQATARAAQDLDGRLGALEQALALQRGKELEVMQNANRVMVIVAGTFAGVGLMAMLLMAYFQWRTVNRLAEIATGISAGFPFGFGLGPAGLGPGGDTRLLMAGPAGQSKERLLGALEQVKRRLAEIEQVAHMPGGDGDSSGNGSASGSVSPDGDGAASTADGGPEAARITLLLGKGQSMLNMDNAEGALGCFDEILALDANHTEALVKKGSALERLRKLNEAIECYDKAIAADASMTIAWLYKGGLFNRMERFSEALECYEQALRTQEKQAA
jgi:tetratricopeptide (TPR) repeat protein